MTGVMQMVMNAGYFLLLGLLLVAVVLGYVFYGVLWGYRVINRKKNAAAGVIAVAIIVFAAFAAWYVMFPVGMRGETVSITISRGCSANGVADSLEKHGVVRSRKALVVWLMLSGMDRKIQAGRYEFEAGQGVVAAVRVLRNPATLDKSITVTEGLTVEQTAERIAQSFPFAQAEITALCYDSMFIDSIGLGPLTSVEGYLFPDTYRFLETATLRQILSRMVDRFQEAYDEIDTAATTFSRHEIVTLASIIEKEAVIAEERTRIAGVFRNRLRLNWPLGADPTVRYVFKKWSGPLLVSELNSASPYNTRRFPGLPPGPICSPGKLSLAAAMSPMRTNELYFVAKWDGSGAHDFSVTNEEHSRKKRAIRNRNENRLQGKE